MAVPKDLLDLLACAFCKSDLKYENDTLACLNPKCGLIYSVKEDIPNMLIDEAQRPCPKCKQPRDWKDDILSCPKCGETLGYERK